VISSNVFADMIEQLLSSDTLEEGAKKEAMRIVRSAAFMNGVGGDVEQVERVHLAQKLLAEGLGAPLIKKRLMSAFQVSYRTSCRDVTKARDLCHLRGTETQLNESNGKGETACTQSSTG
jgi:hypothetical protein